MRSFTQSLNLLTTALGTWLCIPLVYLANADPSHQVRQMGVVVIDGRGIQYNSCFFPYLCLSLSKD